MGVNQDPLFLRIQPKESSLTGNTFIPTVYLKHGCPFCLKLRLFLLEAGQLDQVNLVKAATPKDHAKLADELAAKMRKASFPTAEVAPNELLGESNALIAYFADQAGIDEGKLPTYQADVGGVLPRISELYRENVQLKKAC